MRNIVMLGKRNPYAHGWGCFQCGLPAEGASAVVCDECIKRYGDNLEASLRYFCKPDGHDYMSGRAPIAELQDQPIWKHDMSKHALG